MNWTFTVSSAVFLFFASTGIGKTAEHEKWKHVLVTQFCEALHAEAMCDNVSMHHDTRNRVQKLIGEDFEAASSQYREDCDAALLVWHRVDPERMCPQIKQKYDCNGTDQPALLQDNPFQNPDGEFCSF